MMGCLDGYLKFKYMFSKKKASKKEALGHYLNMVCVLSGPTETIFIGTPSSSSNKLT